MSGLLRALAVDLAETVRDMLRERARRRELERQRELKEAVEKTLRGMAGMGDAAVARIDQGVAELDANMRRLAARCADARCKLRPGHPGAHDNGETTWGP